MTADQAATSLLYSGEFTDAATGQQYLRARFYDPTPGRFNRLDPFAGNLSDSQSLHKYLYGHGNPISNIDPTGKFSISGFSVASSISGNLRGLNQSAIGGIARSALGRIASFNPIAAFRGLSEGQKALSILGIITGGAMVASISDMIRVDPRGADSREKATIDRARNYIRTVPGYADFEDPAFIFVHDKKHFDANGVAFTFAPVISLSDDLLANGPVEIVSSIIVHEMVHLNQLPTSRHVTILPLVGEH